MMSVLGRRVRCEMTSNELRSDLVVKRKEVLRPEPIQKYLRTCNVIQKRPSPVYKYKTCCITDRHHDFWRIPLGFPDGLPERRKKRKTTPQSLCIAKSQTWIGSPPDVSPLTLGTSLTREAPGDLSTSLCKPGPSSRGPAIESGHNITLYFLHL
jgi:hypothetical protein